MSERIVTVTPVQYDALVKLAQECYEDDWCPPFDEGKWVTGVREILGDFETNAMLNRGGSHRIRVSW